MSDPNCTDEFHPSGISREHNGGVAVVSGSVVYYFTTGTNADMKVVTCDVSGLQGGDFDSVTDDDNWSKTGLDDLIANPNSAKLESNYVPAAAVLDDRVYCFWPDKHNNGQIYTVYLDLFTGEYSNAYQVTNVYQDDDGNVGVRGLSVASDLSANVAPSGDVITLNWFVPGSTKLHSLVLDPVDLDDHDLSWLGVRERVLLPSNYGLDHVDENYYRIDSVWFTQGSLGNFMIASFYSSDDHQVYFLLYPIEDDGTPASTSTSDVFTIGSHSCKRGFALARDPAGRVYGLYCKNDDATHLHFRTFNTFQRVQQDDDGNDPDLDWSDDAKLNDLDHDSEKKPALTFVWGDAYDGSVELEGTDGDGTLSCTQNDTYSFVLYADHSESNDAFDIQVQVADYGTASLVPDYSRITPEQSYASERLVSLLMDSFPFPNQNLGDNVTPNRSIIEYTYGASSSTELSAEMSWQLLFGMKSSLSTTKGVGPAAEVEFKTGPSASLAVSTQSIETDGYTTDTTPIVAPGGSPTPYVVESHGEYYGTTPSDVVEDIAIFTDLSDTIVNGVEAPLFSLLHLERNDDTSRVSGQFSAYCYTPGDIYSYQKASINQTMADKYDALSDSDKAYFTSGYASSYVDDVIVPNAFMLMNGKNYLEFTIDGSGHSTSTFQHIDELMATLGWTVEGSAYLGVGFGEELSIFGVGEAFSASIMAGFEYTFAITGGVTTSNTWGINFNVSGAPTGVSGALGYTVRMYICRPSNLWARELQFFSDGVNYESSIDFENSAPSKIVFVVSNIGPTLDPSK